MAGRGNEDGDEVEIEVGDEVQRMFLRRLG
jgi:hypothetical protein